MFKILLALIMKIKWLTRFKKIKEEIKREVKIEPTFSRMNMKVWLWIYFPRKKIMSKLIYHLLLNEKKEFVQGKEQNCFKIKIMLIGDRVLFTLNQILTSSFPL